MSIDLDRIRNPVFDREPGCSARDPALVFHDGRFLCFHSAFERRKGRNRFFLDVCESTDLAAWTRFRRLTTSMENFSSPGNVLRTADRWLLCMQSYPVPEGGLHGGEESRLWLMESRDLETWSEPRILAAEGCRAAWAKSRRQIDPCLVEHDGRFWCFYKTAGALGLLVSDDLETWKEASPGRPVLSKADTPDGSTVENPCVLRVEDRFMMFFAPCREGRGIGVAASEDLLAWRGVHYLDFPPLVWAPGGPTAAMVLDARAECGNWLMAFHGERPGPFHAAMGVAWSRDLEHWTVPCVPRLPPEVPPQPPAASLVTPRPIC